jgi:hypothetical protein
MPALRLTGAWRPYMPTTFFGLFLFSTALSLLATFGAVTVMRIIRHFRNSAGIIEGPSH